MANPRVVPFIPSRIKRHFAQERNDEETNLDCLDVCGILNGVLHQQGIHRRQQAKS
jgi:hypothetical protein